MQKVDKETLLDLHMTIKELVKEVKDLLQLEASADIFNRAQSTWLDDIEQALGEGNYVDVYKLSMWSTLEELGILKMDGTTADLKDDKDEEAPDEETRECSRCLKRYLATITCCTTPGCDGGDLVDPKSIIVVQEASICKDENGVKKWYNAKGQLHRKNGPAVEGSGHQLEWWIDGQRHREDGPAIIFENGDTAWYYRNQYHRADGPAIDFQNGLKVWYSFGRKYDPTSAHEQNYTTAIELKRSSSEHYHTKKETNNEDEDFVEDVYVVNASTDGDQRDQGKGQEVDQETDLELSVVPTSEIPDYRQYGPYNCWSEYMD